MPQVAIRATVTAAVIFAALAMNMSEVMALGRPLGAVLPKGFGSTEQVRCCGWGPRGWYDTWRNCHYCGFGHPNDYCRFSVRRWRWFCPR
jgi:hypothetical protein